MRQRALTSVALLLVAALTLPPIASAATEAALKAQLQELKSQTASAGRDYMRAYWALDETDVRLAKTNRSIAKARADLAAARKRLNSRANAMYRREDLDVLTFLVGAQSFDEFATRLDFVTRIGASDAEAIAEVKKLQAVLLARRAKLKAERTRRAADYRALKRERDRLQGRLASKESEFRRVRAQLDAVRSNGAMPSGVSAMPGPNGMVFPVVGSYYYSNTWGASRSGGRRRHQGTDIMAPRGTPCVAVLSGTVRSKEGGLGGKVIWLTADNGWSFYYAHLDSWNVRSGRVRAGQQIGTVGATGNAAGGAPHLHFEIHPGGGGAVNPYPYLRAME